MTVAELDVRYRLGDRSMEVVRSKALETLERYLDVTEKALLHYSRDQRVDRATKVLRALFPRFDFGVTFDRKGRYTISVRHKREANGRSEAP